MPNEFLDILDEDVIGSEEEQTKGIYPDEPNEEENAEIPVIIPGLGGGDDFRLTYIPTKKPSAQEQAQDEKLLSAVGYSDKGLSNLDPVTKNLLAFNEYVYGTNFFVPERQAVKRIWHKLSSLWENDEPLTTEQVRENCENDGYSDEEYTKFFSTINSKRDYEYTKTGLNYEKALHQWFSLNTSQYGKAFSSFHNIFHFVTAIPEYLTLAGAVKSVGRKTLTKLGTEFPKAMQKATEIASHFQIENKLLRSVVSNSFICGGLSFRDYASQYEMTEKEALVNAAIGVAVGSAASLLGAGVTSIYNKCFDARHPSVQVSEVMDEVFKEFQNTSSKAVVAEDTVAETVSNTVVDKAKNFIDTKLWLAKNPVSILNLNNYSPTARQVVKRLATIGGEDLITVENETILQVHKMTSIFNDLLNISKKDQRAILNNSGKSLNEWIDLAIRGEELPRNLPLREKILSGTNALMELNNKIVQEARELGVPEVQNILDKDFLNASLATKKNLSFSDLAKAYDTQSAEVGEVYVRRVYDVDKIKEAPDEFKEILLNAYKKEKFKEIYFDKKYTQLSAKQKEQLFIDAEPELRKQATQSYNKIINSDVTEPLIREGRDTASIRDIRVADKALMPFFKGGASQHVISDMISLTKKKEIYKMFSELNVKTKEELQDKIRDECIASLGGIGAKTNAEKQAMRDINLSVECLLDYFLGRSSPKAEAMFEKITSTLNLYAYAGLLGKTGINSLSDLSIIVTHYGLKPLLNNSLKSFNKLISDMKVGLTEEEWKRAIKVLPDGLIDSARSYVNKISTAFENNTLNTDIYKHDWANKFHKWGQIASTAINKASGIYYLDKGLSFYLRRAILFDLVENPKLVNLTKSEIIRQIKEVDFSKEVERYVLKKTQQVLIRPTLQDKPMFTYNSYLRPFFMFASWSNALKNKFLFPMLKGDFKYIQIRNFLATLLITKVVSTGLKKLLDGSLDLSSSENLREFSKDVIGEAGNEIFGNCHMGFITYLGKMANYYKYNGGATITDAIINQSPTASYWTRLLTDFIKGTNLACKDMAYNGGTFRKSTKNIASRFVKRVSNYPLYEIFYREMLGIQKSGSKKSK